MAINSGFEGENGDVTQSTQSTDNKNTTNRPAPNENTSFNVALDTYFSDEKIRIPDQVSELFPLTVNHKFMDFPFNRRDLALGNYGHSPDLDFLCQLHIWILVILNPIFRAVLPQNINCYGFFCQPQFWDWSCNVWPHGMCIRVQSNSEL